MDQAWSQVVGRSTGGLLSTSGPADARIGILTLGSVLGTLEEAREEYPDLPATKLIHLRSFRPFPREALQQACQELDEVIVLERAFSPGSGGIVGNEVRSALKALKNPPRVHNIALGLGGRDIPIEAYPRLLEIIQAEQRVEFSIFDADLEKLPLEDR